MNRSEIFTRAWNLYKTGHYTSFSACLKLAWKEAKTPSRSYAMGLPESSYDAQMRAIRTANLLKTA